MITISEKRTLPSENRSDLCNAASFSSYLNDTDDAFLRKLAHSNPNLTSIIVPRPSHNAYIPKKVLDGEIGIFGAEKYFTGAIDEERSVIPTKGICSPKSSHHQQDREEQVLEEFPVNHKTQTGTPSVRSEASWNSRSALLQSSSRNQPPKEVNYKVSNVKSFLACLGCNCNGKDSVKVHKKTGEDRGVVHVKEITKPAKNRDLVVRTTTKSLSSRWAEEENQSKTKLDRSSSKNEDCFSFPVMNSKARDQAVKTHQFQLQEEKEIMRNSSLEVFGSPIMEKAKKSFSLERKLTTLNWDGVTKIPPSNQNGTYDDTASDASSDLFEIESFSTNGNSFLRRQAADYAPSETSIDWSVATASAADFSVISDYNELRRGGIAKSSGTIAWNMKSDQPGDEAVQKRAPGGILSGCASLKSVRVAGDEYRTTTTEKVATIGTGPDLRSGTACIGSPRVMHRLDSATPIAKFQAEAKLTGFDSRSRGQNAFVTRTIPRSHSPHTSRLLYIQ